jgi:hypothetical protein
MKPLNLQVEDFPKEFDFYNGQFPPLDAFTYWHFLKKSKLVIEVGCGYSTYLTLKSGVQTFAIDPCPRKEYDGVNYVRSEVQNVSIEMFRLLAENDILFIDSSHIYDKGSDVEYLIKEVIPQLNDGVLIHFHDYFGADGYPKEWQNVPEMKDWNENEYVHKMLDSFNVLANNYEISKNYNEELKETYPFVPNDITQNLGAVRGASLWITNKNKLL